MPAFQIHVAGENRAIRAESWEELLEQLERFSLMRWLPRKPRRKVLAGCGLELNYALALELKLEVVCKTRLMPVDIAHLLVDFVETIDGTGGLLYTEGNRLPGLAGSPEWLDLAITYLTLCTLLGIKPVVTKE